MENQNYLHSEITNKLIKCYFNIYNKLGHGFLERIYDKAFSIELKKTGLKFESQPRIRVYYDQHEIGVFIPDFLVEDSVVVEIKAVSSLVLIHEDQLRNALRATELEVGILFNFGTSPQFKRKVFSNDHKQSFIKDHN